LAPGRCGSTLLQLSLCNHPDILDSKCVEPFSSQPQYFEFYHKFLQNNFNLDLNNVSILTFEEVAKINIKQYLDFVFENEDIVKILYEKLNEEMIYYLFSYNIKIINLSRKNLLAQLVSRELSINKTNIVTLDSKNSRHVINSNIIKERMIDCFFSHNCLKIYYEDLIENWQTNIKQIQEYIEVVPIVLDQATQKTDNIPLLQKINNVSIISSLQNEQFGSFICIDDSMYNIADFRYTKDISSHAFDNFSQFLSPMCGRSAHFLEIGSHEGRSAVWLLSNILTNKQSTITCVDNNACKTIETLRYNTNRFINQVRIMEESSITALSKLVLEGPLFEFIYIDGKHNEYMPLNDMVLCHELLHVGGIMAIDDYLMQDSEQYGKNTVKVCVDNFLNVYSDYYTILLSDYQFWIQKTRK
jgi:predicted O-methyltransferase YrrM